MTEMIERLGAVQTAMDTAASQSKIAAKTCTLIAVSKTFPADAIEPVLDAGLGVFGENRVQEAQVKWPALKERFADTKLHLIGPLQSNKAKEAVALFDAIQTIDRDKIARVVSEEMARQNRKLDLFIQINTGEEPQKAGIAPQEADGFIERCRSDYGLTITGLMCIPPQNEAAGLHFGLLREIAIRNGIDGLSMGMSADYETAIQFGATHIRVGSALFGARTKK